MTQQKDWTGNFRSMFTTLGSSSHVDHERQSEDYYATDSVTIPELLNVETFSPNIWEPACGEGHLSKELIEAGYNVYSTDLIDRGYGDEFYDFLAEGQPRSNTDIITNPPYRYAMEFVEKSLEVVDEGRKVAMFLKLTFLEGQKRYQLFQENPPIRIHVYSSRRKCAKNGDFDAYGSSAAAYAWFIWEKGFKGTPSISWII